MPDDLRKKGPDDSSFVTEELAKMNRWVHRVLAFWFIFLGVTSIWLLFDLWPTEISKSSADSSRDTTAVVRVPVLSSLHVDSLRQRSYQLWRSTLNNEQTFFLIAFMAGVLGGAAHGLSSLMDFRGNRRLFRSWTLWYFGQPILGGMMAVIFYIAVRAGLISSSADVNVFSPFGIAAISALVGLFTDAATIKLAEVFKTIFATSGKPREGQLNPEGSKLEETKGKTKRQA